MSDQPTPLWRDPLFSPGDRFPLGPATRPFSLRHVVPGARLDQPPTWRYTYCHERQIALIHDEDGSLVPLLKRTMPGATPGQTTGHQGTPDGSGPSPEEEARAATRRR